MVKTISFILVLFMFTGCDTMKQVSFIDSLFLDSEDLLGIFPNEYPLIGRIGSEQEFESWGVEGLNTVDHRIYEGDSDLASFSITLFTFDSETQANSFWDFNQGAIEGLRTNIDNALYDLPVNFNYGYIEQGNLVSFFQYKNVMCEIVFYNTDPNSEVLVKVFELEVVSMQYTKLVSLLI